MPRPGRWLCWSAGAGRGAGRRAAHLAETVFGIVYLTDVLIGLETCTHRRPNLAFLGEDVPATLDLDELCLLEPSDSALGFRAVQLVLAIIPAKRLGDVGEGCGVVWPVARW